MVWRSRAALFIDISRRDGNQGEAVQRPVRRGFNGEFTRRRIIQFQSIPHPVRKFCRAKAQSRSGFSRSSRFFIPPPKIPCPGKSKSGKFCRVKASRTKASRTGSRPVAPQNSRLKHGCRRLGIYRVCIVAGRCARRDAERGGRDDRAPRTERSAALGERFGHRSRPVAPGQAWPMGFH